eukprot:COSAG04_NODE_445_length_14285_cov_5.934795_3_plen_296_part_00
MAVLAFSAPIGQAPISRPEARRTKTLLMHTKASQRVLPSRPFFINKFYASHTAAEPAILARSSGFFNEALQAVFVRFAFLLLPTRPSWPMCFFWLKSFVGESEPRGGRPGLSRPKAPAMRAAYAALAALACVAHHPGAVAHAGNGCRFPDSGRVVDCSTHTANFNRLCKCTGTPPPPPPPGANNWYISDKGASCDTACGAAGRSCSESTWPREFDADTFAAALAGAHSSLSHSAQMELCNRYVAGGETSNPSMYDNPDSSSHRDCFWHAGSASGSYSPSCDGDPNSHYRRICWCV